MKNVTITLLQDRGSLGTRLASQIAAPLPAHAPSHRVSPDVSFPCMESPVATPLRDLVGRRVTLPSYFVDAVIIEGARPLGAGAELRVRLATGELDEAVLSREDLAPRLAAGPGEREARAPADP